MRVLTEQKGKCQINPMKMLLVEKENKLITKIVKHVTDI